MSISKKFVISIFTAAVIFSAVVLITKSLSVDQTEPKTAIPESSAKQTLYTVKEYNGKIAVFSNNSDSPLYVLDTPFVHELSEYDQSILKQGLIAESNTELLKILEDYDH